MAKIKKIFAREILNASGFPTIEGTLILDNGLFVSTSIPSGSTISKYEAIELRDNDLKYFNGLGVKKAVYYINSLIAPKLIGVSPQKLLEIDNWLIKADGTKKKEVLGTNTTLTISQLITKAAASELGLPLYKYINQLLEKYYHLKIPIKKIPSPIFSLISGGLHGNGNLEFQEFLIIPSSVNSYTNSLQIGTNIFHELKNTFKYHNAYISYSAIGTFSPNLSSNIDAFEIIFETITKKNYKNGLDVFMGIDFASDFYFKDGVYKIMEYQHYLNSEKYLEFLDKIIKKYQILYVEDPFATDDIESWQKFYTNFSKEMYICGDDIISSNKDLLTKAVKDKLCNCLSIKPSQLGTITETLEVIALAKKNQLNILVSQRNNETIDDFIADLAVAVQTDFVKFGPPYTGERTAKYNRLWKIENELTI